MPSSIPFDPPFICYLAFSVLLMVIAVREMDPVAVIEQLSNQTTRPEERELDKLLDETGTHIVANTMCCGILIIYKLTQYLVFGTLRVSEEQHSRETFWDYFLQKSLFVLFILDAKSYEERSSWVVWFTLLGSILLLSRLSNDRFEYLSSSPATKRWLLVKISMLMGLLLIITLFCNTIVFAPQYSTHILFLLADASYTLVFVTSVITKFIIFAYDTRKNSVWESRASITYYTDLLFTVAMLSIDLLHRAHLLIIGHTSWFIKGWCVLKIHTLVMELRRKYRKHKNYLLVVQLMESNFAMASDEDIDKNSDDCAICWDEMDSARKLPCGHLFHNSCLRSWLEQDTSCPTCRTCLKGQQDPVGDTIEEESESEEEFVDATRAHQRNHFFHFDSSRYTNHPFLSWLPTISIEGFM